MEFTHKEIIEEMQANFPLQTTICLQNIEIRKLKEENERLRHGENNH